MNQKLCRELRRALGYKPIYKGREYRVVEHPKEIKVGKKTVKYTVKQYFTTGARRNYLTYKKAVAYEAK